MLMFLSRIPSNRRYVSLVHCIVYIPALAKLHDHSWYCFYSASNESIWFEKELVLKGTMILPPYFFIEEAS